MGTSSNWGQLTGKLEALGSALGDQKASANAVGMAGKATFLLHGNQAGVIGRKVAGKRKAINARYDIGRDGNSVTLAFTGPAHLVNNPTRPHRIVARRARGTRTRRKGAQALTIGANVRASANHPGTAGKGFYQRARADCMKQLPAVYGREQITAPLKAIFG